MRAIQYVATGLLTAGLVIGAASAAAAQTQNKPQNQQNQVAPRQNMGAQNLDATKTGRSTTSGTQTTMPNGDKNTQPRNMGASNLDQTKGATHSSSTNTAPNEAAAPVPNSTTIDPVGSGNVTGAGGMGPTGTHNSNSTKANQPNHRQDGSTVRPNPPPKNP